MSSNITFLKTSKFIYLFDGNTGKILRINHLVAKILSEYSHLDKLEVDRLLAQEYSEKEIQQSWQLIADAKAQGLLADKPQKIFAEAFIKQIPYALQNSLSALCLGVTEQCNLRCKYCAFSGIYGEDRRVHSGKLMTFDIAKKAIDYTMARSINRDEYHLSFYGGEPLICLDLIKKCIKYIKNEYLGKRLEFSITTNGTLLTEKTVDYLVEHKVRLYISIDGPEEYHDEYRRYVNDQGSFKHIKENVLMIKAKYPEYYRERVHFGLTLSPFRDLDRIETFLVEDEMFSKKSLVRISTVNDDYEQDIFEHKRTEQAIRASKIANKFVNLRYLVSKTRGDDDYLHKTRVAETFCNSVNVTERRKVNASHRILPSGPCTPGDKLFVSTDGNYMICEKANEAGILTLGNVEEGFDLERAQNILREYFKLSEKECLNCWAYLNCSICPIQIEKDRQLSRSEKLKRCEQIKRRLSTELTLYLAILEKNPLAFGAI